MNFITGTLKNQKTEENGKHSVEILWGKRYIPTLSWTGWVVFPTNVCKFRNFQSTAHASCTVRRKRCSRDREQLSDYPILSRQCHCQTFTSEKGMRWHLIGSFKVHFILDIVDDNSASQELNRILSSSHGTDISMKDNYIFMLKVFILFDMAVFLVWLVRVLYAWEILRG